ncbi:MAG TPA: AAA family ATPase, partial [Chloroflexota bacterium]|nr:AAA family ATPase [Chloroflexota bacterium]
RIQSVSMHDALDFIQASGSDGQVRTLPAMSMSDGTLRALALLVALLQGMGEEGNRPSLVGIEEPEMALHPAATAVLLDALHEASLSTQVLVTTQSPDLLDNREIVAGWLLAVAEQSGATTVGHISEGQRSILRDGLRTAGELLRTGDFRPMTASAGARTLRG